MGSRGLRRWDPEAGSARMEVVGQRQPLRTPVRFLVHVKECFQRECGIGLRM